jgi:hypothetical protein
MNTLDWWAVGDQIIAARESYLSSNIDNPEKAAKVSSVVSRECRRYGDLTRKAVEAYRTCGEIPPEHRTVPFETADALRRDCIGNTWLLFSLIARAAQGEDVKELRKLARTFSSSKLREDIQLPDGDSWAKEPYALVDGLVNWINASGRPVAQITLLKGWLRDVVGICNLLGNDYETPPQP